MRPSAYPHTQRRIEDPKYTLVSDRRGYIFKRNNHDKKAPLIPTGRRRIPVAGTLNLGIKQWKREQSKTTNLGPSNPKHRNVRGEVVKMYKDYAWGQVEKGLENHIKAQDEAKKPKKEKKTRGKK